MSADPPPEGTVLTEDGYYVLRLNGDTARGFNAEDGTYYELVTHADGSKDWFTGLPDLDV